jgi:hypothetical protein
MRFLKKLDRISSLSQVLSYQCRIELDVTPTPAFSAPKLVTPTPTPTKAESQPALWRKKNGECIKSTIPSGGHKRKERKGVRT